MKLSTIPGFSRYLISETGAIYRTASILRLISHKIPIESRHELRPQRIDSDGYRRYLVRADAGKYLDRRGCQIAAIAFLGLSDSARRSDKLDVRCRDGDTLNCERGNLVVIRDTREAKIREYELRYVEPAIRKRYREEHFRMGYLEIVDDYSRVSGF